MATPRLTLILYFIGEVCAWRRAGLDLLTVALRSPAGNSLLLPGGPLPELTIRFEDCLHLTIGQFEIAPRLRQKVEPSILREGYAGWGNQKE